jgi:RNA polymerase sigma-70 factor (ECF subfamily)
MPSHPQRPHLRAIEGTGGSATRSEAATGSSDNELFEGIIQGDERRAVELYHRLLPSVEASLLRVLGRRETDHEDLVQTTFEQIIMTLSKRRYAQACSLKTWASSIAAHVALKSLRSRCRRRRVFNQSVEPDELLERHSSPDDVERTVTSRQRLELVREQLAQLSGPKAEAVLLHDVLGHGLSEIAVMTGSTVAAAQTRLSRGRRELAARLDAVGDQPGGPR